MFQSRRRRGAESLYPLNKMQISKEQAEVLIQFMVKAAEAVQEDAECKNSDYGGYAVMRFTENIQEFIQTFNGAEGEA